MDRAERRRRTATKIVARVKIIRSRFKDAEEWGVVKTPNRCAKKHPLDCGRARCGLCHGHKRFKPPRTKPKEEDL